MTYQRNDTPEPLASKPIIYEVSDDRYEGEGFTMAREYGKTPNGNEFGGRWVLRNAAGQYLDHDRNRADLAERFNIKLGSMAYGY